MCVVRRLMVVVVYACLSPSVASASPFLRIVVVSQIFSCLICYTLKYSDVINEGRGEGGKGGEVFSRSSCLTWRYFVLVAWEVS